MTASLSHIFMIEMISLCECVLNLEERVTVIDIFLIMHTLAFSSHTHTILPVMS